jgi:hypothetical protein
MEDIGDDPDKDKRKPASPFSKNKQRCKYLLARK